MVRSLQRAAARSRAGPKSRHEWGSSGPEVPHMDCVDGRNASQVSRHPAYKSCFPGVRVNQVRLLRAKQIQSFRQCPRVRPWSDFSLQVGDHMNGNGFGAACIREEALFTDCHR